ncbi:pyridoxal phosphate-dependent decarboxylase family protein [Streptomyces sp. NPDC050523]|uniref:pyridoxal phosphate-dependent decarboxylase family protein n=1 Tax=Streptomyces sp. NPDC050523 TaxID=3365622 RepID=UPI0037B9E2D9
MDTERELPNAATLAASLEGLFELRELTGQMLNALTFLRQERQTVLTPGGPDAVVAAVDKALVHGVLPAAGRGMQDALWPLAEIFLQHSAQLDSPACVAHLQCPPLAVAAAAELVVAICNQSPDMWDCGPFAMELEARLMATLAGLAGFPDGAAGVMVPGGSVANLLALVLARDAVVARQSGADVAARGLRAIPGQHVVLCSEAAHFCVGRAGAITGLGEDHVVRIGTDREGRMIPGQARKALESMGPDLRPIALVATAGTTDTGVFDPLPPLAALCRRYGLWFHVDGAYGGPVIFSPRLRPLLHGVEQADSFSLNLHKFGWQPAATSVFLARDGSVKTSLGREVACLNPREEARLGYRDLMDRTLQGTRTADAFRVVVTLQALGADGMAQLVERCHDLARHTAEKVRHHPHLELATEPNLSTVLFRYRPTQQTDTGRLNQLNLTVRQRLLETGRANVGRTVLGPQRDIWLKFALINPHLTDNDIDRLLVEITTTGDNCHSGWPRTTE